MAATSLGIGTSLPNATNSVLMQNGTTLGSISGSMSKTIAQNQLPNVTLSTSSNGAHQHFSVSTSSTNDFTSTRVGNLAYSLADITNQGSNPFSLDNGFANASATQGAMELIHIQ